MKLKNLPEKINYVYVYLYDTHDLAYNTIFKSSSKSINELILAAEKQFELGDESAKKTFKLHSAQFAAYVYEEGVLVARENGYPTSEEINEILLAIEAIFIHL